MGEGLSLTIEIGFSFFESFFEVLKFDFFGNTLINLGLVGVYLLAKCTPWELNRKLLFVSPEKVLND